MADRRRSTVEHGYSSRPSSAKASQVIAADLRRRIVRGEIAAGQALPSEAALVESFHVSRETLREALGLLESETLIVIKRGRGGGAVARRPDAEAAARYMALLLQVGGTTVGEVLEARHVMVRPAAMMLAEFPAPDAADRLEALWQREANVVEDPLTLVSHVCEFEEAIARLAGNKTLTTLISVLKDVYSSLLHLVLTSGDTGTAFAASLVASHRRFVDQVRANDPRACDATWNEYAHASAAALDAVAGGGTPVDVVPIWESRPRSGRLASRVAQDIRARIALGAVAAGDGLAPLPELEREFGVSRPTLREALRILETEGLLSLRAGTRTGATILHPTAEMAARLTGIVLESDQATLADVWQARIAFEPSVMGLSARRISVAELDELRSRSTDWPWMSTDTTAWIVEAMDFRFSALRACRNSAMLVIFDIVRWIAGGSARAVTSSSGYSSWELRRNRDNARTYSSLIAALADGDEASAAGIWEGHLRQTVPYFSQLGERLIADLVG